MNPVIDSLPVLVVNPYSRCNCRCVMCDIWKGTEIHALSREELERQLDSIESFKVQWVVFSGGEPLMHPEIFQLCSAAKQLGARVTILSTGLLLGRYANEVIEHADDVTVSLDGPTSIHDRIRNVQGAFQSLARGIEHLRAQNPDFRIGGRCTVQHLNCDALVETVSAARQLGLSSISFLAVDVHSSAFNRPAGLNVLRQSGLAVDLDQIPRLESQIEKLIAQGECGAFVVESPAKLRRVAQHFRACCSLDPHVAPACNAPWTSAVVEADGAVRPCFFHPAIGSLRSGETLGSILNSPSAAAFRASLHVASNPVCRRCVCSLTWRAS
jgi:radical SAM protein with 4Fe4S-binding SPASM domain